MSLKEKRRRKRIAFLMILLSLMVCLVWFIKCHVLKGQSYESSVVANEEQISEEIEEESKVAEVAVAADTETEETTEAVAQIENSFYSVEIDDVILSKINGVSYKQNEYIDISDLRYLNMLCYSPDGTTYVGEMIVNRKIADKVLDIFKTLYENQYPIERMVLVDDYQGDDELSMEDNNTSAFNFRQIAGSNKLSNHSYGMAIDLNPKYNPYVKVSSDGSVICQPESGRDYIDRTQDFLYKIDENDLAYQLFTEAGFTWGGSWNNVKDYQHFEMVE